MKNQINVVGAVIVRDGGVLCAQRGGVGSLAGKWEFPGGKIELGETPQAALLREIDEELLCEIRVGDCIEITTHEYDFGVVTLSTFLCELIQGTPAMTEHSAVEWVQPSDLQDLDWAAADIPAVQRVQSMLSPNASFNE